MSQYAYLTASSLVKNQAGKVKGVLFPSGSDFTVALYDNVTQDTSNPICATMTAATTPLMITFSGSDGIEFNKGLYVVVGGTSPKVTIVFE